MKSIMIPKLGRIAPLELPYFSPAISYARDITWTVHRRVGLFKIRNDRFCSFILLKIACETLDGTSRNTLSYDELQQIMQWKIDISFP